MSELTITITLGNEAMQDGYEAFQALAKSGIAHNKGEAGSGHIVDDNGNTVGNWVVKSVSACSHQIQVATLARLKEHTATLIWMHDDMSIRQSHYWLSLLSGATGDALTAQGYGFGYLHTKEDIIAAEAILRRFINIFGGTK